MLCETSKRKPQLEKSAPYRYLFLTVSIPEVLEIWTGLTDITNRSKMMMITSGT
jgi:hypothetical protein